MQWWSPTEFGENHCLQLRNTTVCSGLWTLGSYLDPLLKNASGISLRTTSQRRLLPWSYLIIPVHPLSPLTLFGTSSRNESALPSPSPSSPFWHAPFVHRAESPEEGPGSPNPTTPQEFADFECLLLWALGQETHSSRTVDQGSEGKQSRLPKLHCNSDKVRNASLRATVPLDTFGFVNAGCQRVPHNIQEETVTWHSHPSATAATGANSSLIQLYAPYTHSCIPFAPWYVSPRR